MLPLSKVAKRSSAADLPEIPVAVKSGSKLLALQTLRAVQQRVSIFGSYSSPGRLLFGVSLELGAWCLELVRALFALAHRFVPWQALLP